LLFALLLSSNAIAEPINLLGSWEATTQDNHWQMEVTYNQNLNQYEGKLKKQGVGSQSVGFSADELVWTATPTTNTEQLKEQQKWRTGGNGVSTGFFWREGVVYLNNSTESTLFTSQTVFSRVSNIAAGQACTDVTSVSPSLNIHIPNANYQTLGGTMKIWADLQFVSSSDGLFLWKLSNYGVNK
jgi:hypothetical protein